MKPGDVCLVDFSFFGPTPGTRVIVLSVSDTGDVIVLTDKGSIEHTEAEFLITVTEVLQAREKS